MDRWIILLAACLYAANFLAVVVRLREGVLRDSVRRFAIMGVGVALQTWVLWERGQLHGRCPITNACEVLVFVAWAIVLWYFVLGPSYRLSLLGIFTSALVALLMFVAAAPGVYTRLPAPPRGAVDPWLELHGSLSLLAYGAFGVAALAGLMYLVQDRQLKRHRHTAVFFHLPPISHLFQAMMLVLTLGCVLLVAGMWTGYLTPVRAAGAKLVVSYGVLALYAGVVVARWFGLGHRRLALASAGAFVVAVVSLWFVS